MFVFLKVLLLLLLFFEVLFEICICWSLGFRSLRFVGVIFSFLIFVMCLRCLEFWLCWVFWVFNVLFFVALFVMF